MMNHTTKKILGVAMSALVGLGGAPAVLAQSSATEYYTSVLDVGMVTEAVSSM